MGKNIWGDRPRVNFILKKPGNGRRTFQVLKRVIRKGESPKHEAIENERIKAINSAFMNGLQDQDDSEIQVREVMADLQKIEKRKFPKTVHNAENFRALQAYWDRTHDSRELIDPKSAFNRLARAVEAVGEHSIYSASKETLQKAINAKYRDNRQRDTVGAINQLLAFIGRGIELVRRPEVIGEVRYLTPDEMTRAQKFVTDPLDRLLQRVAFNTGLRIGEIFALNQESAQDAQFFSQFQIDRDLERRHTKRRLRKRRRVYVLPGGEPDFKEWAAVPLKTKLKIRNQKHAEILGRACEEAFPNREDKRAAFHDLRHSYAIYLVSRGVNLTQVAQCLNNSVSVCEKYYSGFVLKDETIESIKRIIEANP